MMLLYVSGSDRTMIVAEKHAVNSNSMKPPFPAGTELAMFGQASSLIVKQLLYDHSVNLYFCV